MMCCLNFSVVEIKLELRAVIATTDLISIIECHLVFTDLFVVYWN
jgi:hypothetical protein